MRRTLALVAFVSLASSAVAQAPLFAKDVAAPPNDILSGRVQLPQPESLVETSRTALVPVRFQRDADGEMRFRLEVPGPGRDIVQTVALDHAERP